MSSAIITTKQSFSQRKKRRVVYYYDEAVGNFYYGSNHPMKPHRIRMTHSLIVNYGLFKSMAIYRPFRLEERDMTLFHADDYVHFLKSVTMENETSWGTDTEKFNIDIDCPVFDGVYRFCQISAGGSVGGAYKLNHGLADIAINWAGGLHHAKKAEASGFCYINDIVLAILELLKFHNRVLYIDIDIHHGDGVEEAFYTTSRVMTVSFHKYGDFFPGTGAINDSGVLDGKYYSINVPLQEGMNDDCFQYLFQPIIHKVIELYQPGAIVLQMGADSLAGDRLGCFNLTIAGHGNCLSYVKSFNIPVLVLGGGGYTLRNVSRCWTYETSLCCNIELSNTIPYFEYYEYFAPDYTLCSLPTNMVNANTKKTLQSILSTISGYLSHLAHAPSVQIGGDQTRDELSNSSAVAELQNEIKTSQLWIKKHIARKNAKNSSQMLSSVDFGSSGDKQLQSALAVDMDDKQMTKLEMEAYVVDSKIDGDDDGGQVESGIADERRFYDGDKDQDMQIMDDNNISADIEDISAVTAVVSAVANVLKSEIIDDGIQENIKLMENEIIDDDEHDSNEVSVKDVDMNDKSDDDISGVNAEVVVAVDDEFTELAVVDVSDDIIVDEDEQKMKESEKSVSISAENDHNIVVENNELQSKDENISVDDENDAGNDDEGGNDEDVDADVKDDDNV